MSRFTPVLLALTALVAAAPADDGPPVRVNAEEQDRRLLPDGGRPFSRQRVGGSLVEGGRYVGPPGWRLLAGWAAERDGDSPARVRGPDDLLAVALEFGTGEPVTEEDPFLAAAADPVPEGLRIRIDPRRINKLPEGTANLPKQALGFFRALLDAQKPQFCLLHKKDETTGSFPVLTHSSPVPPEQLARMTPFLRLLRKVSTEKKGRVFWLVEPGDPDPSHVVLGWQPHGVAWAGAELASPAWESSFLVGAFEPPPEWSPPGGAGRLRTGLGALAPGTWKVLEQCRSGTTLVALGREGVVLEKGGVYEVHTLRAGKDAAVAYDPKPLRTRGLARAPAPAWTTPFGLPATWTVPQARHLVALAVCSPAVWRRHREPGDPPAHHARALFMDPELWACPPES